ncbi:MAG: TolC family protein [Dysgonamonadaceae bacterium]|jgi:cobalt-zinc-cadmium resistance protein CzcA|nr:TolC family protein [Dysgonamonadaceae bacterium]
MYFKKIFLITILFPAITANAQSQEIKKTLQECIEFALENNLSIESGEISVKKAKYMQGTAFNIDKTQFSLSQDPTSGGNPDNSVAVIQSLDFPTTYIARKKLLQAETQLERSNLQLTRNEVIRKISELYFQLLYQQEKIRILKQQDSVYKKFLTIATAKFNAGETNRLELINAERLLNENRIELHQAAMDFFSMQLSLKRLTNSDNLIIPAESSPVILNEQMIIEDFNPNSTPLNKIFEDKKMIGQRSITLAKNNLLPDFNLALRNQLLIKDYNPYNIQRNRFAGGNFMGFEAGISIPIFFGEQKAKVKTAKIELELIKTQQADAMKSLNEEYLIALNEYEKANNELTYYQNQGNSQANEISRISQVSYEKGEIGYLEFIQNIKSAAELHLKYAGAVNNYNQTIIIINYLKGNK